MQRWAGLGGNQLPGAEVFFFFFSPPKPGECVGYPCLCYWGRGLPSPKVWDRAVGVRVGSVCVLGVAHLAAWVSGATAAAAVSGSREQVNRLVFRAWVWVPRPRGAGGAPARGLGAGRERPTRAGSSAVLAPGGRRDQSGRRDLSLAGTESRSLGKGVPICT